MNARPPPTEHQWDAVVVGAGPAGTVAAYQLARTGRRTLLLEKREFPRHKVCGCCVSRTGVALLDKIGLARALDGAREVRRARLHAFGRACELSLPPYRVLDRATMDTRLAQAAREAGATVRFGHAARVSEREPHRVVIERPGGREVVSARAVVVADGIAGSTLRDCPRLAWRVAERSRVGIGAVLDIDPRADARGPEPDVLYMSAQRSGYAGVTALDDRRVIIAGAINPRALAAGRSVRAVLADLIKPIGIHGDTLRDATLHGAPHLTRRRRRDSLDGWIFLAGDARGYVEPITGEGMTWAFQSGVRAASAVERALDTSAGRRSRGPFPRDDARLARARCRTVAGILRVPWLARGTAGLMRGSPRVAGAIVTAALP